MKKITLLMSFLLTIFIAKAQCDYYVVMQDAYGDGWNGASLDMSINGVVMTSFTVSSAAATADSGSYSTYTGDNVEFYFNSGTWDTEITFQIYAPDGSSVGSYGPYANNSGNDGSVWTGVSNSTCAPPACLDPYGLSASNGTSSSIDVSWTGGPNATTYNVEYGVTGYTQGSGTTTTASTASTTITGLTAYTVYDIYVQADCGANGTSTWAGPISYSTCPGAAPYLENFDATPASQALTSATGPCWTQSTNDVFDWIINNGPTTSQTTGPSDDITGGGNYMYTETSVPRAAGDSAILISPSIDISSLTSAEISFQCHMYGASMGTLRVDASSDGGTTFNTIWTKTGDQGDVWTEEIVQLTGFTTTAIVKFVSTVGVDAGGTISYWSDMAIDNFQVRQSATCPQTSPLTASNVTSSSADVSWTAGGTETSWNVEYGAAGFTLGTGTNTNVTSTTYTMTGLTPSTDYDVYVQAVCSATDQSFWVGPLAISTPFVQPGCGDNFGPYCYGAGSFTVFTSVVTNPGDFITLNITAGETEVGYDNLQIYDGVGATGNLLYDADGDHTGVSVLSTTGTITMYIDGDAIWNCVDGVGGPYVPIEANITCSTPSALDMKGVDMTTPSTIILANGPVTVSGKLQNMGTTTVTSMDVNYSVDGGATVTESLSGLSLATGDYYDFNHGTTWSPTAAGVYDIAVWATNINGASDMNTANDMVSGQVTVYDNATIKRPMLESFTSSTCGPCVAGNVNVASVLTAYSDDQYSLLKYQMSWPGSGDPYYTLEGGDRRTYYNVNAVPDFILDGNVWQGNSSSLLNSQVDAVLANPAFAEISSYFTVTGQTVDITVSINPIGDFANSLTLYTAIYEIKTYNNVGSNGETEFGNVMKKMVPGSMGFALPTLQTGVTVVENFSHTFQGSYTLPPDANSPIDHTTQHSIEDFNNLGVVTWIQDDATKEVIQSTVSTISGTSVEELSTTKLMLFPNPAENTATVAFEGLEGSDIKIDLYNLLGELVFTGNHTSGSNFDYYNIDVTTLNNGIYNLVLTVGESMTTKKLQILK
jgi:hypothetical protein